VTLNEDEGKVNIMAMSPAKGQAAFVICQSTEKIISAGYSPVVGRNVLIAELHGSRKEHEWPD